MSESLSLIVALSANHIIGRDGGIPFRQSADLRRFKQLTMGHHLIMGRKTFVSLGRALPGRTSIVLSRQERLELPAGVLVARDLDEALLLTSSDSQPFIIGGGEIYRLALPHVDTMYITRIDATLAGDTYFPDVDFSQWRLALEEKHPADAKNEFGYAFETWIAASSPID